MSLSSILNIATSGVLAQQVAIAATAENIANVTTPDFSRREVNFSTDAIEGQFSGVTVEVARAAADQFLQGALFSTAGEAAGLSSVADSLSRIVESLGSTGDNISFANQVDEALASLARLNANPSSPAARIEAVTALNAAFSAFSRTQNTISQEIDRAASGLTFDVEQANGILSDIFSLNNQIAASGGENSGAADALTARLSQLSSLLDITVLRDDIGRATISTGEGRILANPVGFATLQLSGGAQLGVSTLSVNGDNQNILVEDISSEIDGGTIGGAIALLSTQLPAISQRISAAEEAFATVLNNVAARNTVFPPPPILAGNNAPTDSEIANLAGTTTLSLISDQGVLSGRIDIDFDNNTISIEGGGAFTFTSTVEGFSAGVNAALQSLDNGQIQGAGQASATLVNGTLNLQTTNPQLGFAFANDEAGLAALFGFNAIAISGENGFEVSSSLLNDPQGLAAGRIDLSNVQIGDIVTGANDGFGASALFEAGRAQTNDIANLIGEIGALANRARGEAAIADSLSSDIAARLSADNGVNLEEELSNLILFQRSFNANARVISAVDELYQSILALI